jgi:UDP-N-acetylglucosamine 2-epimerase (non-hydrolysing)
MRSIVKVIHVIGARPNFMKAASVLAALAGFDGMSQVVVHTGQHYDVNMSDIFFQQLGMPEPHINLEVGSGSHARQTAEIMSRLEPVLLESKPDLLLVYGDVNSTVAAALVCSKLLIQVAHVEAGLRSFDRTMPEEINRLLTDQIADLLFTPSTDGNENLIREGIVPEKIYLVGNVMIDTLIRLLPFAENRTIITDLGLREKGYGLVTLHRPSNVDDPAVLNSMIGALNKIGRNLPLIFSVHPRTRMRIAEYGLSAEGNGTFHLIDPVGYLDFLSLQRKAKVVITDSGGIQEETTFLGIPCLTVRKNTERPITVTLGTNILVGQDMECLCYEVDRILGGDGKTGQIPPFWDGKAGERIADIIARHLLKL